MDARNILSVAGVLLVLGGVGYFWGLGHKIPLEPGAGEERRPDYEATGIHSQETGKNGQVQRRLDAPALRHYSLPRDEIEIDLPVLRTFDAGHEVWQVQAQRALSLDEGREIHLEGGVSAERKRPPNSLLPATPLRFVTRHLTAWPDEERAHSDSGIRVTDQQGEISSQILDANLKTGSVTLKQNVTGIYAPTRQ